jgi:acyl-CoA thioester hydrolase
MDIVHHSNYIRYFEEARLDFLEKVGFDYAALEKEGIISPVLATSCQHKAMAHYGETLVIKTTLSELGNVKYSFSYVATNAATGELVATGTTTHCFVDSSKKIVSLKKLKPEEFEKMKVFVE